MSAEKNITRKDVAEKAGVSVSVVSRVLNNSGYVDKEKKKKIIKIADRATGIYSKSDSYGSSNKKNISDNIFLQ